MTPGESRALLARHPDAQTAARLVHGACSCDLVRYRQLVTREDEAHLRARYRTLGLTREDTIRALENHRRAQHKRLRPEGHWPRALASFAVEHARNAGPTLYYLHFTHTGQLTLPPITMTPITVPVAVPRENPGGWLLEETLVMLVRR